MSMKMKLLAAVAVLGGIAGMAADASASTSFLLGTPGVSQTLGSGWGTLSGQLDATFSINNPQSGLAFSLNPGEISLSYGFGNVTLNEQDISSDETNNLFVTYTFNFDLPTNQNVQVSTTGVATVGPVSDAGTDLVIDFSPVQVNFGVGGSFFVSVADMSFNTNQAGRNFQPGTFSVQLISDSQNVPEPMTLGLLGAGLLGMGIAARRRRS
ncbi:MAG: PEP-CTERM sorting domain-containing protein [Alphaproteobacteria bacterium]|nr:PEP-CTERM sorting domain-containing protein [Alphaproteobacteria bacterium]